MTGQARWTGGSGVCELNARNPVLLPARESRFNAFAVKSGRYPTQPRLFDVRQYVDVNDPIDVIRDFAGDQWHGPAAGTDMECGRPGAKGIR